MRKPLQPLPESRNPQQLALRLAARSNGWPIIPCEAKAKLPKGWPTMPNDARAIRDWDRPRGGHRPFAGTGVRIEDLMFVVDIDITTRKCIRDLLRALRKRWPGFFDGALERSSGGVTLAFFGQVSKPVGYRHTARYGHGDHVEVFGSEATRYVAIDGPHSVAGRVYSFKAGTPWDTRLDVLPVFDADEIGELIDLCDEVLARHLPRIPNSDQKYQAAVVYDLEPGQTFILTDGTEIELTALERELMPGTECRGILTREAWSASTRKDHCNAIIGTRGQLIITDFMEGVSHRWLRDKPIDGVELSEESKAVLKAMVDKAQEAGTDQVDTGEPEPKGLLKDIRIGSTPELTYNNALACLLECVAWFPQAYGGRGGAVSIYPTGEFQAPITLTTLRQHMMGYSFTTIGERGGVKTHNPVDAWMLRPERVKVSGVRMRPELPRPLFDEGDQHFINRYRPPAHPRGGGSTREFDAFLERLVPDPVERAWVRNWLASKVQNPHWRMIALAMVARENGSGRGLLSETLGLLLGDRFVVPLPYAKLSGGSGSRFNAEMADKLLVCINESRDADDRKFAHKNAAREALKDFVEPNHELPFRVEPKNQDAYFTRAAISTLVFSNNIDGLPIGDGDRRMAVVLNGPQMTADEVVRFRGWLGQPENIGALYRALSCQAVESDRNVFDPYMAPEFHGRDLMIEASKTALDRAWDAAVAKIGSASDLYTMAQIIKLTRHYTGGARSNDFDDLVEKHTIINGYRIGTKHSTNWLVTFQGERQRVYALDDAGRRRYGGVQTSDILKQLVCSQKVVDSPDKLANKLLHLVEKGTERE